MLLTTDLAGKDLWSPPTTVLWAKDRTATHPSSPAHGWMQRAFLTGSGATAMAVLRLCKGRGGVHVMPIRHSAEKRARGAGHEPSVIALTRVSRRTFSRCSTASSWATAPPES